MEHSSLNTNPLHFVVEANIPYIRGVLEPYGTVSYLAAGAIDRAAVANADAVIVRTRTRCNEALLSGSRLQLVATATIGTDHIDLPWCAANGIEVVNAPGCNAPAVAQYVMASLATLANRPLNQYVLGIVGVGHVGKIVERWARKLDMQVLVCDPPRQRAEGGNGWSTLAEIAAKCDAITFHTPLNRDGDDRTFHIVDAGFFSSLRRAPIVVNAARGPIVDTPALVEALKDGTVSHAVIDTWEKESDIDAALLALADIATPHIAGYSAEGKMRATRMVLDAVSRKFGLPQLAMPGEHPLPVADEVTVPGVLASYNPLADTTALRANPAAFEALRNNYPLRHEPRQARND